MATLGSTNLTLGEIAKRLEYENGPLASIIEVMSQTNEIWEDIPIVEGNLDTGMRTTIRTGIPQGTWRRFNEGYQPVRSTTSQIEIRCGQLATFTQVDVDLADLGGRREQLMADEAKAAMEGLSQQVVGALLYDNQTTNPERITGLSNIYNSLSAENAQNIIDAGGTGSDNTSVWLVGWGQDTICGVTPKGLPGGLRMINKGVQRVFDATGLGGAQFDAYVTDFKLNIGLAVRDWRQAGRICNIDVSNAEGGTDPGLLVKMREISDRIYDLNKGKFAFYMNRATLRWLGRYARAEVKAGGGLTYENIDGKRIRMFDGIPIRITDQILQTEARVT